MIWQTTSTDSADTERLGELLGTLVEPPLLIELQADLGGGKTTFVRGLARGLGSKDRVASPTFTLNKIYKAKGLEIHHFDFYRLSEPGIIADQLEESLQNSRVITVVEWGGIVSDVLPPQRLSIEFAPAKNSLDERLITIKYSEPKARVIKKLESLWEQLEP